MTETRLITPQELAEMLRVPLSWVYKQTSRGSIPFIKAGRHIRFLESEVLQAFGRCSKHGRDTSPT